jgi:hypothetical protein
MLVIIPWMKPLACLSLFHLQTIKGVLAAARLGREGPDSNPKGSFPTFWKERFRLTHVKCSLSGRLDKNVVIFALESVEN